MGSPFDPAVGLLARAVLFDGLECNTWIIASVAKAIDDRCGWKPG
jgi:hypothetical protein